MKKCIIFYNDEKIIAEDFYKKLLEYIEEKSSEISLVTDIESADFVILIGGDGTFLRATKEIIKNSNIGVLAINAGSLGFLTEIKIEEAFQHLESYLNGDYILKTRRLLEINVKGKNYNALNEAVISKGGILTKLLRISAYDNGKYINTYRADGLIVSTPIGSTAYSMSAGGPIISPELEVVSLTPIAPHNLSTRPLIISGEDELTFKIEDKGRGGYVIIDGDECIEIQEQDIVTVKYSEKKIKLILSRETDYYSILREKLKWGDKLC